MNPSYVLDTNVLLYAISRAEDHLAKRPMARQWVARADWAISAQVLMELYNNLRKPRHGLNAALAGGAVQSIAERYPVLPVDAALVVQALDLSARHQISHWDAAIVCAAARLGAHTVISEDLAHGQVYDGVRVLNPFAASVA